LITQAQAGRAAGMSRLTIGMRMAFDVQTGERGLKATNIRPA